MNKIAILLSTFNGEKYLEEQLDSIFNQTYKNIEIFVRDDGSNDKTLNILKKYNLNILLSTGNVGIKKSFESILKYALQNSDANYFMFCDQDDIWKSEKIEKSIEEMKKLENLHGYNTPFLIHTDLEVVNDDLKAISDSMWKYEKINPNLNSLNRLLVQNTITGCTMMINRRLAEKSLPILESCIMHDWWIGLVASCFGKISYLTNNTIKYRQHGRNDTGSKKFDLKYIIKKMNFKETDKYIIQSKSFLEIYKKDLDEQKIELLENFSKIKEKSFLQRVSILIKYKILKNGIIRNIGLLIKI